MNGKPSKTSMFFGFSWVKKCQKLSRTFKNPYLKGKTSMNPSYFHVYWGTRGLIHIDMLSNVHPETGMIRFFGLSCGIQCCWNPLCFNLRNPHPPLRWSRAVVVSLGKKTTWEDLLNLSCVNWLLLKCSTNPSEAAEVQRPPLTEASCSQAWIAWKSTSGNST